MKKEDIESLGFDHIKYEIKTSWIYRFICLKRNEIELFVYENDRILIVNCFKNKTVFDGCVKDTSELNKILKKFIK